MVQQQGPEDPRPYWVLPGGLVESGELLHEALIRETDEEAGLQVEAIAQMAYCTQIDHPQCSAQTVAFAFDIAAWSGTPQVRDPDGEILQVAWTPTAEALERLQEIGWRGMREPMLAYLRGDSPPGVVWMYRESADDQIRLTDITAADR
jgi:8-oxo-dGTP diphosphatase